MLARREAKGNSYWLLVRVKTGKDSMEISVEIPLKADHRSTTGSSFTINGHIPKGLYNLLLRYLLISVHCQPIHNIQQLETAKMTIN